MASSASAMMQSSSIADASNYIWHDREIRFDAKQTLLACRKNEQLIDSINSVEDTKGNNGERGSLIVTNLRIIWVSHKTSKINLSIGLNCVINVTIKKAKSKLNGYTQALCVIAKYESRFEFVFTSLVKNSPRLFTTVQAVMRAYETSKLYRDLKLRGSVINESGLILLPSEEVFTKITGVWNLSSEQGNLGTFYLTNVRVVWHANMAINFNVSFPYMQIKSIRVRDSKFGNALVIETFPGAGGYILGFRIDDANKLEELLKQIHGFYRIYANAPIFGVDFVVESEVPNISELLVPRVEEDTEILEENEDSHAVAACYAEGFIDDDSKYDRIDYDDKLGLAIESMQDGLTLDTLWRVI